MGWVVLALLLAIVGAAVWFVVAVSRGVTKLNAEALEAEGGPAVEPGGHPPDPGEIEPFRDLRHLPSTRYRIRGSAFVVSDANRKRLGGGRYQLVREPENRHDACAVAIYGQGQKVGYVSAKKAASLAPLLDRLGDVAFVVGGAGVVSNSIRLWVDLPHLPELRAFVKSETRRD